jgi:hypothetical protein
VRSAFGFAGVNHVALLKYQIVCIVNYSKYRSTRETPRPTFYLLLDDDSVRFGDVMVPYLSLLCEPADVTRELQQGSRTLPGLAATEVATMEQEIEIEIETSLCRSVCLRH